MPKESCKNPQRNQVHWHKEIIVLAFENCTGNFGQCSYSIQRKMPESCISFLLDDGLFTSQMCSGCCRLLRGEQGRGRRGTVHKKINSAYSGNI